MVCQGYYAIVFKYIILHPILYFGRKIALHFTEHDPQSLGSKLSFSSWV